MTIVDGEQVLAVLVKMLHQGLELCRVNVPRNQLQKDEVPITCSFGDKSDLRIQRRNKLRLEKARGEEKLTARQPEDDLLTSLDMVARRSLEQMTWKHSQAMRAADTMMRKTYQTKRIK